MVRKLALSLILMVSVTVHSQVSEADSLALVDLYESTNGTGWTVSTSWLVDSVTEWFGVTVSGGRVTRIQLGTNNLIGPLPVSIGDLTELSFLGLMNNQISDTIPSEIGNLTKLVSIFWANNQLSGKIPSTINKLTSLIGFFAKNNQLAGPLPSELGGCTELVNMVLDSNQIDDTIPSELGLLGKLQHLSLRSNKLTGSIPPQLGNISSMKKLYLSDNQLSGAIPPELGNLSNADIVYLGSNQLSDTIPSSLGNLSSVTKLYLGENQLTGTIPDALDNLLNLTWLSLANNRLEGTVPSTFTSLTALATLILSHNRLTGLINFTGMPALASLNVEGNSLTFEDIETNTEGTYMFDYSPQDSVDTARVYTLVEGNSITLLLVPVGGAANQYQWMKDSSDIPGANATTFELTTIVPEDSGLYNCKITNTIATELTIYSRPQILNVIPQGFIADSLALIELFNATDGANWLDNTNWLTVNALETWFGVTVEAKRVTALQLPSNYLSGTVPLILGNLTKVLFLDLSGNALAGSIPPQLGNCTELLHLDLSHNQFTDTIPATFSGLSNLEFCAVDSNQLTVFPAISALATLDTPAIEYNRFTFGDIEPHINIAEFTYSPQDTVGIAGSRTLIEADPLLLYVTVGGIANQYQWIKNGADILNVTNDTLLIASVVPGDSGIYTCRITNTLATGLTLVNHPETVTVIPQGFIDDSLALIDLYNSTAGTGWPDNSNWLTANALSTWYGVSIAGRRLSALDLSSNNLTGYVPASFGNCIAMKWLDLSHNNISGKFPDEMNSVQTLQFIALNSNLLDGLPEMTSMNSFDTLHVQNNRLTFEDILPYIPLREFIYAPQDSIGEKKDTTLYVGDTLLLTVSVGGTGNTYQWSLNAVNIAGATNPVYVENSVLFSDSGSYVCAISNPGAPALVLYSRPTHVLVEMSVGNQLSSENITKKYSFNLAPNPLRRDAEGVIFDYSVINPADVEVSVYDPMGNLVHRDNFPAIPATARNNPAPIRWNLKNRGVKIACGSYLAVFKVKDTDGTVRRIKRILAVKCE